VFVSKFRPAESSIAKFYRSAGTGRQLLKQSQEHLWVTRKSEQVMKDYQIRRMTLVVVGIRNSRKADETYKDGQKSSEKIVHGSRKAAKR